MGANLNSNATTNAFSSFDTETVSIVRESKGATPGQFTKTTIYSGPADFQVGSGTSFVTPSGVTMTADAEMSLDPIAGVLPTLEAGDIATYNSETYTIAVVQTWVYPIKHVSAVLKLGVLNMKPKR